MTNALHYSSPKVTSVSSLIPYCIWNYWHSVFISLGILESPQDLFESIRSALSSESQAGSVEFVESQSALVIRTKLFDKLITWNIVLHRVDPIGDERAEQLAKQVEQLTARVQQLEQVNPEELAARVKQLEQNNPEELTLRLKHVEELLAVGKQVQRLQFAAVTHPNFTLSSDRTKVTKTGAQAGGQGFLSEQPLSAVGGKFAVVFDRVGS